MIKRFFIIAIFGVFTFNANILCHSLHPELKPFRTGMDKHGNAGHSSSTDVCPIKGACPHHNNNSQHQGHHKNHGETFIKCDCSADYTATAAYEIIMQSNSVITLSQSFAYNLTENKQIFSSREPIPSERPPSILA